MGKERMTAFTDGVLAVIITIMVLDLKAPESADLSALARLLPTFLSYVLSFVYVAIYWNNHHHLLAICERVSGAVLWANMHLLFWLSLIPFTTAWLAENHFEPVPTLLYGASLFMPALAYALLARTLIGVQGAESVLAKAVGGGAKETASLALYGIGIACALWAPAVALAVYVAVAALWLIPDRRIERMIAG